MKNYFVAVISDDPEKNNECGFAGEWCVQALSESEGFILAYLVFAAEFPGENSDKFWVHLSSEA